MGLKYLLDTDICVHLIRARTPRLRGKFEELETGQLGLSLITVAELRFGADNSSDPERHHAQLSQFLCAFELLDFDSEAAGHYGQIRSYLQRKGTPIGSLDMLIAAQARARRITLVTHNVREFKRVPDLAIEIW
jgi:tRNA(fMet)-specific endonuclease VapC